MSAADFERVEERCVDGIAAVDLGVDGGWTAFGPVGRT